MLPSGLPENVADEEDLARFLTSSSQFNATGVKAAAFLPNPKDQKKSVFRHGAEPRQALVELARTHIAANVTVHGAGMIKAAAVRSAGLDVIAEEPPPRHAKLVGWPVATDPELQKAQQKERAMILAANSALLRFTY